MRNRHLYPSNWEAIALEIKQNANWICQGCAKPCRRPKESIQAFISRTFDTVNAEEAIAYPQRYCLTVAHLDHTPPNCDYSNLRALCSVCHLRYDKDHHVKSRKANKAKKLKDQGQLSIFE